MIVIKKIDWIGFENEYVKVLNISDEKIQIEKNFKRKNKSTYYDCQCKKCNKVFSVSVPNIKKVKSCGCSRIKFLNDYEKEIGNTYGKLTIIKLDTDKTMKENSDGKHKGLYYVCKCECGIEKTYRLSSLRCGHIKSCGCSMFNNPKVYNDLTGNKYGRLTVLRRDLERDSLKPGRVHWICQCECGNIKSIPGTRLTAKNNPTKSCGCLQSEITAERNRIFSPRKNKTFQYKINPFTNKNEEVIVWDENEENSFIIDAQDAEYLLNWYWRKDKPRREETEGYWITNAKIGDIEMGRPTTLRIHQLVAERKYGEYDKSIYMPDHLNRNHDDNRRCNIVLKTNCDNCKNRNLSKNNTSGKTGVYFDNSTNKWIASITINYNTEFLGRFDTFEKAVEARKEAEIKHGFTCDDVKPDYDYEINQQIS